MQAAADAARAALEAIDKEIPAGATRYRELPVMVRLDDGTLIEGRIDLAWSSGTSWTVVDFKTDRMAKREVAQLQLYGLALQRTTGLPAKGLVLEI